MAKELIFIYKNTIPTPIVVDMVNRKLSLRKSGDDLDWYPYEMKYKKRFYKVGYTNEVGFYTILGK